VLVLSSTPRSVFRHHVTPSSPIIFSNIGARTTTIASARRGPDFSKRGHAVREPVAAHRGQLGFTDSGRKTTFQVVKSALATQQLQDG